MMNDTKRRTRLAGVARRASIQATVARGVSPVGAARIAGALATTAMLGCSSTPNTQGESFEWDTNGQYAYWVDTPEMTQWYEVTPKNTMNLCFSGYFDWDNSQVFSRPHKTGTCSTNTDCGSGATCGCSSESCETVDHCVANPQDCACFDDHCATDTDCGDPGLCVPIAGVPNPNCQTNPETCTCSDGLEGSWASTSTAFETTKRWYQEALEEQWGKYSDLTFVWHGDCPTSIPAHWVPIRMVEGSSDGSIGGYASWGAGDRNGQTNWIQGTDPESSITVNAYENGPFSEPQTKSMFVHEVGHVLGWPHEHERADRPMSFAACDDLGKATTLPPNHTHLTEYDPDSIMNYCRDVNGDNQGDGYTPAVSASLTAQDRAGAQMLFGFPDPFTMPQRYFCSEVFDRLFVGRFDANATADALCLRSDGQIDIDLANANGHFEDTNSSLNNFCTSAGDRLVVGDANGDGRDDLICNNSTSGNLAIRYATTTGTFPTTNWTRANAFCGGSPTRKLLAGDFTGDGRVDLLCQASNGAIQIDFADANGQYTNINWTGNQPNFCTQTEDRLLVVNATSDSRNDLVCYTPSTGNMQTMVSVYSIFTGNVFTGVSSNGIPDGFPTNCPGLFPADLNGDGRDDLVCPAANGLNVALPSPTGTYSKTQFKGPFGLWCNGHADRMYAGAFRGADRDDLLCISTNGTISEQFSLYSSYTTRCDESNSIDLGPPNNSVTVADNACVMIRGGYPSWWGTRAMRLQNPQMPTSYITSFVWNNTCAESAGSGKFVGVNQEQMLRDTSSDCATFIELQNPGVGNITLRYVAEDPPCDESSAIDLGAPGNETTVRDDACVMVRNGYPNWWGTRPMKLQDPVFGGTPTAFTWSNTCSNSSGSGTFAAAWDDKVLVTTNSACATLIDLGGSGATNLRLRYYSN